MKAAEAQKKYEEARKAFRIADDKQVRMENDNRYGDASLAEVRFEREMAWAKMIVAKRQAYYASKHSPEALTGILRNHAWDHLGNMGTKQVLKALAKESGIKGYSRLSKWDLTDLLVANSEQIINHPLVQGQTVGVYVQAYIEAKQGASHE